MFVCTQANKGVRITATDDIQVTAYDITTYHGPGNSAEAFAVWPSFALGSRYIVAAYPTTRYNYDIAPQRKGATYFQVGRQAFHPDKETI